MNYTIEWDKTIGGDDNDQAYGGIVVNDTLFIVASSFSGVSGNKTAPSYGSHDLWILALDMSGNILWQNSYGGSGFELSPSLLEHNGNLIATCRSSSPISGNKTIDTLGGADYWLLRLSRTNGTILNQKVIGTSRTEQYGATLYVNSANNLVMTTSNDGDDFEKAGYPGYGNDDMWVLELDENFNILQQKCFGGTYHDFGVSVFEHDNKYYFISNSLSHPNGNKTAPLFTDTTLASWYSFPDIWLVCTDLNFNILWDKSYGGNIGDSGGALLFNSTYNRFVLSGYSNSQGGVSGNKTAIRHGQRDVWAVVLDVDGNILEQKTYGAHLTIMAHCL